MSSLQASSTSTGLRHDRDDARRIRALERTIGELREHIRQLEDVLAPEVRLPREWKLTPAETRLFRALIARELLTKAQAAKAIATSVDEVASEANVSVRIYHLRRKLSVFHVEISNLVGHGWCLEARLSWRAKLG